MGVAGLDAAREVEEGRVEVDKRRRLRDLLPPDPRPDDEGISYQVLCDHTEEKYGSEGVSGYHPPFKRHPPFLLAICQ